MSGSPPGHGPHGGEEERREGEVAVTVVVAEGPPAPVPAEAEAAGCPEKPRSQRRLLRAERVLQRLSKIVAVVLVVGVLLVALVNWPVWLIDNEVVHRRVMSALFLLGLALVALEDFVGIDKAAVMLILAAILWVYAAVSFHPKASEVGAEKLHRDLNKGLEDTGSIILFLLPAMGVVESIDHFDGFSIVNSFINRKVGSRQHRLLPIVCVLSFFMSSVIDNLTATIVSLKILRNVVRGDDEFRRLCGGLVVIAANAGGAWSPIGDVTTTMLWIQGRISVLRTVTGLLLPSLAAGVLPLAGMWCEARRRAPAREEAEAEPEGAAPPEVTASSVQVLALGIGCILMVPALKMWTGLPPYLGMLFALGIVWVVTDWMVHGAAPSEAHAPGQEQPASEPPSKPVGHGGVPAALHKVDLTGLLFFTGVLLAVVALDSADVLRRYAASMVDITGHSPAALSALLGVSSAVVDNVPLVEASIEMFEGVQKDDPLWQLVALAAGTGGSILSVGSIAGVTFMGMEGVGFRWYCRRVSPWAAVGFGAGIATYQLQRALMAAVSA